MLASYSIEISKSKTHSEPGRHGVLVLLDVSPSLWGPGVWTGKTIAITLARSLPSGVMLAISRFCGKPRLVHGPEVLDARRVDAVVNTIESIRECKATNLLAAIEHAVELTSSYNGVRWSVVIVSDVVPSVSKNENRIVDAILELAAASTVFIIPVGDANRSLIARLDSSSNYINIIWPGNGSEWVYDALAGLLTRSRIYDHIPYEILVGHPVWVFVNVYGLTRVIRDNGIVRIPVLNAVMEQDIVRLALIAESHIERPEEELVMPVMLRSLSSDGFSEKVIGMIELG